MSDYRIIVRETLILLRRLDVPIKSREKVLVAEYSHQLISKLNARIQERAQPDTEETGCTTDAVCSRQGEVL